MSVIEVQPVDGPLILFRRVPYEWSDPWGSIYRESCLQTYRIYTPERLATFHAFPHEYGDGYGNIVKTFGFDIPGLGRAVRMFDTVSYSPAQWWAIKGVLPTDMRLMDARCTRRSDKFLTAGGRPTLDPFRVGK